MNYLYLKIIVTINFINLMKFDTYFLTKVKKPMFKVKLIFIIIIIIKTIIRTLTKLFIVINFTINIILYLKDSVALNHFTYYY